MADHVSTSTIDIDAPPHAVWRVLVSEELLSRVMFGATVRSDFRPGSPITFTGEWDGRRFQDHGEILEVDEARVLRHTHFSPLSGQPDVPENHHTLTWSIDETGTGTRVTLTQTNNPTQEAADHSSASWARALHALKTTSETLDV